jgi:hypothetical protein
MHSAGQNSELLNIKSDCNLVTIVPARVTVVANMLSDN